jgi:hypothetical protein
MKAVAMVVATVLAAAVPLLAGGHGLSQIAIINLIIIGLGACSVYVAPNVVVVAPYTKAVLAALTAAATALATVLGSGGVTAVPVTEWLQIVLAALGAVGVYAVPNVSKVLAKPAA